jgi:hypothetical protein
LQARWKSRLIVLVDPPLAGAGVEHPDQLHPVGQRPQRGLVEPVGIGGAAMGSDPARDRLLGRPSDGDHQAHVAVHDRLVEDAVSVLGDR